MDKFIDDPDQLLQLDRDFRELQARVKDYPIRQALIRRCIKAQFCKPGEMCTGSRVQALTDLIGDLRAYLEGQAS